jgi:hypothetical protein
LDGRERRRGDEFDPPGEHGEDEERLGGNGGDEDGEGGAEGDQEVAGPRDETHCLEIGAASFLVMRPGSLPIGVALTSPRGSVDLWGFGCWARLWTRFCSSSCARHSATGWG